MGDTYGPAAKERSLDWLTLIVGPLVLLLLLALGVEARPGEESKPRPAPPPTQERLAQLP
jgi:hypothetical protein